jgi:Tfp pilus assembly protein PilE
MQVYIRNRAINFRLFNGKCISQNVSLTGLTFIELVVVFLIVVVLAALAIPQFRTAKERVLDKEAESILRLMRTAENAYHMDNGVYRNCADINAINTNLRLNIAPGSPNWAYKVTDSAATDFICKARRSADNNRIWCLNRAAAAPSACGTF